MKRESYDVACLASMLIHFLTTVGVNREESVEVLRMTERMLPQDERPPARAEQEEDAREWEPVM